MKTDRVYRTILLERFEEGKKGFTQRGIALSCGVSLGLVNFSLRPLRRMGAVVVHPRELELVDPWKALLYWCSKRNLQKDTVYSTHLDDSVSGIEARLPHDSIPTAYTAYKERFDDAPSEYSEAYCYGDRDMFTARFGNESKQGWQNLIVLETDENMASLGRAPLPQVYADLWNIDTWYAKRYVDALGRRLRQSLSGEAPEFVA